MYIENTSPESPQYQKDTHFGWIEVIAGPMFSGKTEELLRRFRRAEIAGLKTILFKPKMDIRYSETDIISHNKSSLPAIPVASSTEILELSEDAEVVGIDECQFFDDGIISVANQLANSGKRIILAGLDMDYKGQPFGPMPNLMAIAEYVTKVHAICRETGGPAHYSKLKANSISTDKTLNPIQLGAEDSYEAVSRKLFYTKNE